MRCAAGVKNLSKKKAEPQSYDLDRPRLKKKERDTRRGRNPGGSPRTPGGLGGGSPRPQRHFPIMRLMGGYLLNIQVKPDACAWE
jgi:hypothetical protein